MQYGLNACNDKEMSSELTGGRNIARNVQGSEEKEEKEMKEGREVRLKRQIKQNKSEKV